ncbi:MULTISPECIES: cytochrome c oxidase subunit 3 [Paenibacillus]|uniref:cytochrome c oxidase subunit 3 n=1 Tax=Paenibacillus TaxID=44249 RepID=UPI0003639C7D|nr:cytochrome c oxidase subunit 3 [Paenibacillus massiliensis]
MAQAAAHNHHGHDHGHHDPQEMKMLGFWIFLVTDVILFSTIFATFIVLQNNTAGGPGPELFNMTGIIISTFVLLTSSFTSGLAVLEMNKGKLKPMLFWLAVTLLLGLTFLGLEIHEFRELVHEGAAISTSAYWTAFYTLVGTHGLHVTVGAFWLFGLMLQLKKRGITADTKGKVNTLSLYWHFLDAVWIFVLSVVYLMGVM